MPQAENRMTIFGDEELRTVWFSLLEYRDKCILGLQAHIGNADTGAMDNTIEDVEFLIGQIKTISKVQRQLMESGIQNLL